MPSVGVDGIPRHKGLFCLITFTPGTLRGGLAVRPSLRKRCPAVPARHNNMVGLRRVGGAYNPTVPPCQWFGFHVTGRQQRCDRWHTAAAGQQCHISQAHGRSLLRYWTDRIPRWPLWIITTLQVMHRLPTSYRPPDSLLVSAGHTIIHPPCTYHVLRSLQRAPYFRTFFLIS